MIVLKNVSIFYGISSDDSEVYNTINNYETLKLEYLEDLNRI